MDRLLELERQILDDRPRASAVMRRLTLFVLGHGECGMIRSSLIALALVFASNQVSYAEVVEINRAGPTCDPKFGCLLVVEIRGEITDATVAQLSRIIERTRRKAEVDKLLFNLQVELNSPGGSVDAAMAIGRIVRKEEAGAFVNRGAVCLSSCVLILAGGSFRSFEGKIGIHRPYLPVPSGDVSSQNVKTIYQKMLQDLRTYFREMNVADELPMQCCASIPRTYDCSVKKS